MLIFGSTSRSCTCMSIGRLNKQLLYLHVNLLAQKAGPVHLCKFVGSTSSSFTYMLIFGSTRRSCTYMSIGRLNKQLLYLHVNLLAQKAGPVHLCKFVGSTSSSFTYMLIFGSTRRSCTYMSICGLNKQLLYLHVNLLASQAGPVRTFIFSTFSR